MSTKCLVQDARCTKQTFKQFIYPYLPSGRPGSGSLLPSSGSLVSSLMGTTIPGAWVSTYRCLLCSEPWGSCIWEYTDGEGSI